MKIIAIICELNPFHNGHKYLIDKARADLGADYVIAVMSGNFVQRGTPAITDKSFRAKAAVLCGADAVFELPVIYATSSAKDFAFGAVSLINSMDCVDYLVFGSESGDIKELTQAADFLRSETPEFKQTVNEKLKEGLSYPAAIAHATALFAPHVANTLKGANNTLGIEYISALKLLGSKVKPYTIKRYGNEHESHAVFNDTKNGTIYASASLIRETLIKGNPVSGFIPSYNESGLLNYVCTPDDFSVLLSDRLAQMSVSDISILLNSDFDIASRIKKKNKDFLSFSSFADTVKNKSVTRAVVSRILIHAILNIKESDTDRRNGPDYLRLLALNKSSSQVIKEVNSYSKIPVVNKVANYDYEKNNMLSKDIYATDLYRKIISAKYNVPYKNDIASSPELV